MAKTKSAPTKESLKKAFVKQLLLSEGKALNEFSFCHAEGIEESELYAHYGSLVALERDIWKGMVDYTIKALNEEEAYAAYSVREKALAFFYTFFEIAKGYRSYIKHKMSTFKLTEKPAELKSFREAYKEYAASILAEGFSTEEILQRPKISERYDELFWLEFMSLIRFWVKDDSDGFEHTDTAIEKAVNLSFDLLGKGPLDSMIDFAKFLYQSKKW